MLWLERKMEGNDMDMPATYTPTHQPNVEPLSKDNEFMVYNFWSENPGATITLQVRDDDTILVKQSDYQFNDVPEEAVQLARIALRTHLDQHRRERSEWEILQDLRAQISVTVIRLHSAEFRGSTCRHLRVEVTGIGDHTAERLRAKLEADGTCVTGTVHYHYTSGERRYTFTCVVDCPIGCDAKPMLEAATAPYVLADLILAR